MSEKRKYMRFKLSLKGKLALEGGMQLSPQIQMVDFSRDGLRITFPQTSFLKSNMIKLEFYLPNRELPIVIEGKTRWMRSDGPNWDMGMRMEKIDAAEKNEILDYAYRVWKETEKEKETVKEKEKEKQAVR
jgi:hypothetical protein